MKKTMIFVLTSILLLGIGMIAAQQGQGVADGTGPVHDEVVEAGGQNGTGAENGTGLMNNGASNKIKDGETYMNENGETVRVRGENNKIKLQAGNSEADTDDLNITSEDGKLKAKLSNGRNAEIKVMPNTASETALARLRLKVCTEERNCTIELKEVGQGNETKLAYELQIERHSRILGIFQAKMQVRAQVDAENGEVIRVGKPWWAFLASEPEETETEVVPEETEEPTTTTETSLNETETENESNENTLECLVDSDCPISNCPEEANSTCIEGKCAVPACIPSNTSE